MTTLEILTDALNYDLAERIQRTVRDLDHKDVLHDIRTYDVNNQLRWIACWQLDISLDIYGEEKGVDLHRVLNATPDQMHHYLFTSHKEYTRYNEAYVKTFTSYLLWLNQAA